MPFVNIRTVKGLLNKEQKRELHKRITELMVEIEGGGDPSFQQYVWILVEEQDAENWGVSGVSVTPEAIKEMKEKQNSRN